MLTRGDMGQRSAQVSNLEGLVERILGVFRGVLATQLQKRWSEVALRWATSSPSRLYASKSFQVCNLVYCVCCVCIAMHITCVMSCVKCRCMCVYGAVSCNLGFAHSTHTIVQCWSLGRHEHVCMAEGLAVLFAFCVRVCMYVCNVCSLSKSSYSIPPSDLPSPSYSIIS